MRKALLILLLAVPAAAQSPVKAVWKSYEYDGPRYRGYECVPSLHAVQDVLDLIRGRRRAAQCSWSMGVDARWEALAPAKPESLAVARLVRSLDGKAPWLIGLDEKWSEGAPAEVDAVWARGTIHRTISDLRDCNIYSETMDYLLERLPVRGVQQSVFCQPGSSWISVSFEFLARKEGAKR